LKQIFCIIWCQENRAPSIRQYKQHWSNFIQYSLEEDKKKEEECLEPQQDERTVLNWRKSSKIWIICTNLRKYFEEDGMFSSCHGKIILLG